MTKTSIIALRIEPETKEKLEKLYSSLGLTVSGAISMFIHQSLIVGGLPFNVKSQESEEGDVAAEPKKKIDPIETIDDLKRVVRPIAVKYGIKKMFLYGSRARGDNKSYSDYNISVAPGKMDLDSQVNDLIDDLEAVLDQEVNVVNRKDMKADPSKESALKEEIKIYDRDE